MKKKKLILIVLGFILLITVLFSLRIGSIDISFIDIFTIFKSNNEVFKKVLLEIRLPRVLNSLMVGAALACSGIILQTFLQNNLAEPGLLGISAGAGLGAILFFLFSSKISFFFITPFSFVSAILTTILVYFLGKGMRMKVKNSIDTNKIILAGIAINAILSALNGFLLLISGNSVSQIIFWLSGGFSGRGWNEFYTSFSFTIVGIVVSFLISKDLNILNLGDELASSLGLNVKFIQTLCIILVSMLAASSVAVAGIISFVGLVVPNISKLLCGNDNRFTIPCSIMLGAIFLTISDTIARTIIAPAEIPVGIITSFIGAPIFIWLILRTNKKQTT